MIPAIPLITPPPSQQRSAEAEVPREDGTDENVFSSLLDDQSAEDETHATVTAGDDAEKSEDTKLGTPLTDDRAAEPAGQEVETLVQFDAPPLPKAMTLIGDDVGADQPKSAATVFLPSTTSADQTPNATDPTTLAEAAEDPASALSTPRPQNAQTADSPLPRPTTLASSAATTREPGAPSREDAARTPSESAPKDVKGQTKPRPNLSAKPDGSEAVVTNRPADSDRKPVQQAPVTLSATEPKIQVPNGEAAIPGPASAATSGTLSQVIVEHRAAELSEGGKDITPSRLRASAETQQPAPQSQSRENVTDSIAPKAAMPDAPTIVTRDAAEPLAKLDPASPAFERVAQSVTQSTGTAQPAATADQARQIAQQMAAVAPTTVPGTTEISLQPEELGRVRMTLSVQDGALTLIILADRPETSDLMRRNIDHLAQVYRQMGFESLSFSFAGSTQQETDTEGTAPTGPEAEDVIDTASDIQSPTALPTHTTDRLDLRI